MKSWRFWPRIGRDRITPSQVVVSVCRKYVCDGNVLGILPEKNKKNLPYQLSTYAKKYIIEISEKLSKIKWEIQNFIRINTVLVGFDNTNY